MAKSLTEQVGAIKEPLSQFTEQSRIMLDANNALKTHKRRSSIVYFLIAGIPAVVVLIMLIWSVVGGWNTTTHRLTPDVWKEFISATGVVFIISTCISFAMWFKRESEIRNATERFNSSYAKVKQLSDVLKNLNVGIIPPDYRYRQALEFIYKALLNQRATTMQQAVNLYEDDLHKRNMESMQRQQVALLQKQAADIQKLQKTTKHLEWMEICDIFIK